MIELLAEAAAEIAPETSLKGNIDGKELEIKPDPDYNPDEPISFEKRYLQYGENHAKQEIKPDPDYNPDKPIEVGEEKTQEVNTLNESTDTEKIEKKGGSYAEVKENSDGATHEVHHMPADSVTNLPYKDGPAIKMEIEDHKKTASNGSSRDAREYRQKQKELIDEGKFREAFEMDVDDIREEFGDKYDDAIAQAEEYLTKLENEGKLKEVGHEKI